MNNPTLDDYKLIREMCLKEGDFTLSHGGKSKYYFDSKQLTLNPYWMDQIKEKFLYDHTALAFQSHPQYIGGPATSAVPIISSLISSAYWFFGFYVDKNGNIEGYAPSKGNRVVLVEDVITTGDSTRKTIKVVEDLGASVKDILCILDRQEYDAVERLTEDGYKVMSIFTLEELLNG